MNLVPLRADHAAELYPLLLGGSVTTTLRWDGPASLDDLATSFEQRALAMERGESYAWTIVAGERPVGTASLRRLESPYRGEVGLWIGEPFQGKGIATAAVREIARLAAEELGFRKLEAQVFVGNQASRRVMEKTGFRLECTLPAAIHKQGRAVDVWLFGLALDRSTPGRDGLS